MYIPEAIFIILRRGVSNILTLLDVKVFINLVCFNKLSML